MLYRQHLNLMSTRKLCILASTAVFLFLFSVYLIVRNISDVTADLNCYIPPEKRKILLDLFQKFQTSAKKYNASCWLNFGGLLGSYRYENVLPWDKDLDFACLESHKTLLKEKVVPELSNSGIDVKYHGEFYFRLKSLESRNEEEATVDVKMYKLCSECEAEFHKNCKTCSAPDDLIRLHTPDDLKWLISGKTENYKFHSVFPLRPCKLARIQTFCPRDTKSYLKIAYPKTWNSGFNVPYKLDCWIRFWQAISILSGCKKCREIDQ